MMDKNLDIGLDEFKRMNRSDKDVLIYKNLISIRSKIGDYNLNKKIQYIWLFGLTIFVGIKKYIGL